MAIASFEFDLDEPEDYARFQRHARADDMAIALSDFVQYMRGELKYKEKPDDLEKARENFFAILDEHGINLDTLLT